MATRASDFLAQNPNYIGRANTSKRTSPKKEDEKKSKRGSGNQSWLSSIISEVAGAGGATGGAALGAGIGAGFGGVGALPGAVIGGLIGGFGGGFGGRLVENQVRDNEFRVGDAAKEGLVSGAFGAGGAGFQGIRGLGALGKTVPGGAKFGTKAITGAKALGGLSDDAAKAVVLGGKKTGQAIGTGLVDDLGRLQYSGISMQKGASGLGAGAKAKGMERLGAQQGDDLLQFMKNNRIPVSAPEKALRPVEKLNKQTGARLAEAFNKSTINYSDDALKVATSSVDDAIKNSPAISKLSGQAAKDFAKQKQLFLNAKTPAKMWEFKKALGPQINFGASADSKTVQKELVARLFRSQADEVLNNSVKGVAQQNAKYSTGKTLETLLKEASKPADRAGLWSRIMTSEAARGTEAKIGQGIQGVGNVLASAPVRTGSQLARGTATRGLANSMMAEPQNPSMQDPMMQEQGYQDVDGGVLTPEALYGTGALSGAIQGFDQPMMSQDMQQPQQAYGLEQGLQDAYRVLGDGATSSQYLQYAKAFMDQNEAQSGGASGPDITKVTGQQYQLAQRGASSVDQLEQLLMADPGVLNRSAAPGRKLPIVGGFISDAAGTGDFDAIGYNVASALLRIETGAQANPQEIKNLQTQMMPRAGDSPETVQTKLAQLRQAFAGILNTANGSPNSMNYAPQGYAPQQPDLSSMMMEQQYAPY